MEIVVATDGSAINNPNGPGGWAWFVDDKRWDLGSAPKASNQVMEMFAILRALKSIPSHLDIRIQTDSAFCVNMVGKDGKSGWMHGWKRRGWVKPDGKIPANLKLVKALDEAIAARRGRIVFEWVKGHNGHSLNSMADRLCTSASSAQNAGKPLSGGPGWVDVHGKPLPTSALPAAPSARRSVMTPSRPTLNGGRPAAPKKAAPVTRRRVVDRSVITSFDDDGPVVTVKRPVQDDAQYCDACGGRINLATMECRCSN